MIGAIRTWLMGIICCAAVVALAEAIMPKGTVRKIGMTIGGLVLMVTILQPVLSFDFGRLSGLMARYRLEAEEDSRRLAEENQTLMGDIIEEQTAAYIADKAEELGASVQVDVTCQLDETGFPYPTAVTVSGNLTEEQRDSLSRCIEGDFAVPVEHQNFVPGEEGTA